MKRFVFYILFFLLSVYLSKAQFFLYNNAYIVPTNSSLSDIYSVVTTDTGYLCIGITKASYTAQSLVFFTLDEQGIITSSKEIGYTNTSYVMPAESYSKNQDTLYLGCLRNNYNYNPIHKEVLLYKFYNSDTIFKKEVFIDTVNSSAAPCVNFSNNAIELGF